MKSHRDRRSRRIAALALARKHRRSRACADQTSATQPRSRSGVTHATARLNAGHRTAAFGSSEPVSAGPTTEAGEQPRQQRHLGHRDALRSEEVAGHRRVRAVEALDRIAERVAAVCGRQHRSRTRVVRPEHRAAGVGEARAALRAGRRVGVERQDERPERLERRGGVPACEVAAPQVSRDRRSAPGVRIRNRRWPADRPGAASRVRRPRAASRG